MSDPMAGKYTLKHVNARKIPRAFKTNFSKEFEVAKERLAHLGGEVTPGVNDYEAFIYQADGIRLIFYPHKTSAGNYHIRVRRGGPCNAEKLREAIFALAENSCTFYFPTEYKLHNEASLKSIGERRSLT